MTDLVEELRGKVARIIEPELDHFRENSVFAKCRAEVSIAEAKADEVHALYANTIERLKAEALADAELYRKVAVEASSDLHAALRERDALKDAAKAGLRAIGAAEDLDEALRSRLLSAEAEIGRLKGKLQEIEDMEPATQEMSVAHMMAQIARSALSHTGEAGE